jgi:allophanate hydrolase subunit 2
MAMHVLFPGPRTTIQDQGRPGYQNSGFAPGGFMDRDAAKTANVLVGNEDTEAVLEFCLIGPVLFFDETVNIAVSGGDFGIDVEGTLYPADRPVRVPAGKKGKMTISYVYKLKVYSVRLCATMPNANLVWWSDVLRP